MITYIYALECPIRHNIIYIGKTININERYKAHCKFSNRNGKKIGNYLKYIKSNGLKPIMSIIDQTDDIDWSWLEKYWISQFKTWGFNLLNSTDGGEKQYHYKHTSETKKIISEKQKNRKLTKEWRDNISKGKRGVKFSEIHVSNLSKSLKGRDNVSIQKKVYQLNEDLKIKNKFNSITKALIYLNKNINDGSISRVCKGKSKSAFGYYWCYVTDYDNLDTTRFKKKKKVSVLKIDINSENTINEYESVKDAAIDNNCHYTSISHVCNNHCGSVNGHIFLFKKDYSLNKINEIKKTVRKQKNGNFGNN